MQETKKEGNKAVRKKGRKKEGTNTRKTLRKSL